MTVDLSQPGTPRQLILQVGPVVFGTALRDALPVISFGDFVNQIEYAEVSRALNDRAIAAARNGLDLASLKGKTITFSGAVAQPAGNSPLHVTPLAIAVAKEAGS
jgi:predicted lipoprotein